jgi:RNA polymerase sigma-70 factor (ECF subfamily)
MASGISLKAEGSMMSATDEEEFISRLLMYQEDVYAYILTLLARRADAEEVAQQTALVLWRCRSHFDSRRDFLPWAFGVARNEVRRRLRESNSKLVSFSPELIDELAVSHDHLVSSVSAQRDAMDECLGQLEPVQRQFIERCYQGQESIKSIASEMATTPTALYLRLHRLRKALVDCVGRKMNAGAMS